MNSNNRSRGTGRETTRMSFTLPVDSKDAIQALADRMGVSESSATLHLIKIGLTAEAIAFGGGEITAHMPNGQTRHLADKQGNYFLRTLDLPSGTD